jgi:hypothetical protein
MNTETLFTSLIATKLSSVGVDHVTASNRQEFNEYIAGCKQTTIDANLDARYIARGFELSTNFFNMLENISEDLQSLQFQTVLIEELLISIKQPQSVLIADGATYRFRTLELLGSMNNVSINFVNNHYFFWFEEHLKNTNNKYSFGYSAYLEDELIDEREPKFDMVLAAAHNFHQNTNFLEALIDSLNSGGILMIQSTNHSSEIYSPTYKFHEYYPMHEILMKASGKSFHIANFHGFTVFVKD